MINITESIKHHITKKGRGGVFTPNNFLNISHRNTIDKLLSRLAGRGFIRHIGHGLYDYPILDIENETYLSPKLDAIIRAIEVQYGDKLQYGGEYSCYLLDIKKDKPKQILYLGNTRARKIHIPPHGIIIKKTKIPSTKNRDDLHILAIQSLIFLGKKNSTTKIISHILNKLDKKELVKFKKITKFAPVWISNCLKNI